MSTRIITYLAGMAVGSALLMASPSPASARDAELEQLEAAALCQAMPYRCTPPQVEAPAKKVEPAKKVKPAKKVAPTPATSSPAVSPVPTVASPVPVPDRTTVDRLYTDWDAARPGKRNAYEEVAIACMAASGVSPRDTLTPSTMQAFTSCVDLITGAFRRTK
jgi:hypothetical protein